MQFKYCPMGKLSSHSAVLSWIKDSLSQKAKLNM